MVGTTKKLIIAVPGDERMFDSEKIPPQWAYVGTVQVDGEPLAGALLRNILTGEYGQFQAINPDIVRPLDAMAVAAGLAEYACPGAMSPNTVDTSEAARLVGRARQTVSAWAKSGLLKRYNTDSEGNARYLKNSVLAVAAHKPECRRNRKGTAAPDQSLPPAADSIE